MPFPSIRRFVLSAFLTITVIVTAPASDTSSRATDTHTGQLLGHNTRYKLNPGDTVTLQYRYTSDLNQDATIEPDGYITMQLVGDIKVAGLTLPEATETIKERLKTRLEDPVVVVTLKDFVKPYVYVSGQVKTPGRYELRDRVTVFDAITMAGGLIPSSKEKQIILVRRVNDSICETRVLDMKKLLAKGRFGEDPEMRPGDMIYIPQNMVSKVERFVHWTNLGVMANPALQ